MSTRKVADVSINPELMRAAQELADRQARERARVEAGEDAVTLDIGGGKEITMAPPKGGTMRKIAMMLGDESKGNISFLVMWMKALLYVRAIDGTPVGPVNNIVDLQKIADQLGDRGEDLVMSTYEKMWPMPSKEELPIVKK